MPAVTKEIRKDILLFNTLIIFTLAIVAVVLLQAPVLGSLPVFIITASVWFNMILSYNLGLHKGLILATLFTFIFGSYILYDTMVVNRAADLSVIYLIGLFLFPISSFLAGKLSATVEAYERQLRDQKKLEQLVTIDASTGFYNHQGFFKKLDEEFLRAKRYKSVFSILLIKISNFDELQIIYGELNSVKILQAVSDKITGQTRFSDIKAILSGNMLSIVLPETNEDGAKTVVEKLHQAIDAITIDLRGARKVIRIKPNIGIASIRESDADVLETYQRAEEELKYDRG